MTRLLVSVRDAAEARAAVAGGADLIDVKEPARGSLGRADVQVWREVRAAIGADVAMSVALGELLDEDAQARELFEGVHFAKIGMRGCAATPQWPSLWRRHLDELPAMTKAVAVAYADWSAARAPTPWEIVRHAIAFGCAALLIDTYDKHHGDVLEVFGGDNLARLIGDARAGGLLVVVGGSLTATTVPVVHRLAPDYLAVRGAVCRGTRVGRVDALLVQELAELAADPEAPATRNPPDLPRQREIPQNV